MVGGDKASAKQAPNCFGCQIQDFLEGESNLTRLQINPPQSSIDSILRGLTDRPNVESTLILSRRDGSIIKATGFASAERRRRTQSNVTFPEDGTPAGNESTEALPGVNSTPSPAEELAASIFQFVKCAASLGMTLCSVAAQAEDEDGASFRRSQQGDNGETHGNKTALADSEELREESQAQLMRLRIKSREIIIFPDPQYLCCVVQRIGKQGTAVEGR